MKHDHIDLSASSFKDLEYETFCANNFFNYLDDGEHIPFIERQIMLAERWLSYGYQKHNENILKRLEVFVEVCKKNGLDLSSSTTIPIYIAEGQ